MHWHSASDIEQHSAHLLYLVSCHKNFIPHINKASKIHKSTEHFLLRINFTLTSSSIRMNLCYSLYCAAIPKIDMVLTHLTYSCPQFPTSPRSPSSLYLRHSRSSDMVMANTDTISAANFFRLTSLIFSWISWMIWRPCYCQCIFLSLHN